MQAAEVIKIRDSAQGKILDAALQRFRHYGYNKTTMAEIAEDAGMSAANLYRHFQNKQEIAARCVEHCISERLEFIRQRINQDGLSAREKLKELTIATLEHLHDVYSRDIKINELIGFIADERRDIGHNKIEQVQEEIKKILEFGIQTGEFEIEDITKTTKAIYSSIALFDTPVFLGFYSLEEYKSMASEVVDLIFNGLKRR